MSTKGNSKGWSARKRKGQNVRPSSKEAFFEAISKGVGLRYVHRVFRSIQKQGRASRKMIAKDTGIDINAIPRPVLELLKMELIEEEEERTPCKITGNRVFYLSLTD